MAMRLCSPLQFVAMAVIWYEWLSCGTIVTAFVYVSLITIYLPAVYKS